MILYRSDRLTNIAAGESCVLYEPVSELESLWAPELFYLDDVWYVYFAAKVPGEPMHQMYVLSNENADPFAGSWAVRWRGWTINLPSTGPCWSLPPAGTLSGPDGKDMKMCVRIYIWQR